MVEPVCRGDGFNPGWDMINAGIRHLFRLAVPAAEFVSLPMLRPWDDKHKSTAKTCDYLVLAGNPRYDMGEHRWLYAGVIDQMLETGVKLIDAWGGSAVSVGNGKHHDAARLSKNPRNLEIIERLRKFHAVIVRDHTAQLVNDIVGLESIELPCSSWWAARELGITKRGGNERVLIAQNVSHVSEIVQTPGYRVVAINRFDRDFCKDRGIDAELVPTARGLLDIFAGCAEVISCRLHAAIPAASLGCKVGIVAIDTRAETADAFGIPWFSPGADIVAGYATEPLVQIDKLRGILC